MASVSLFHKIPMRDRKRLIFHYEGQDVEAFEGDSVAAALLAAGLRSNRDSVVSGEKRAPLCMMGVCFECLLEINGEQNKQACMTPVEDGMKVKRQNGVRVVGEAND